MFFKKHGKDIPPTTAVALTLAALSLVIAAGVARWALFLANDLIAVRKEFAELRNAQEQLTIQFDFWDQKVTQERAALREKR